jgi:predicted nucleotide-binding protein
MTLLSKLEARDGGDPSITEERESRIRTFQMPEFGGQEHNDAKTLELMGWIRSSRFGTNLSNSWSGEGIYALNLTEDGKAALEAWRASNRSNEESMETQSAPSQQSRPKVMLVHGSQNGQVPPIVDTIRLWCFDHGLDAYKAADRPNSGRFVYEKVDDVMNESDYYIVVLTTDEELTTGAFRPRPNTMIEMGRLMATNPALVCVLKEQGVEMPSDYTGLVTEPLENWESVLERELRNASLL